MASISLCHGDGAALSPGPARLECALPQRGVTQTPNGTRLPHVLDGLSLAIYDGAASLPSFKQPCLLTPPPSLMRAIVRLMSCKCNFCACVQAAIPNTTRRNQRFDELKGTHYFIDASSICTYLSTEGEMLSILGTESTYLETISRLQSDLALYKRAYDAVDADHKHAQQAHSDALAQLSVFETQLKVSLFAS